MKKKIFVVHEHHAKKLHWDFRLEMNRILKSWAIPKEPPKRAGLKRLAIQVADHALSYAKFKGEIKDGYGAGLVKIWDSGTYDMISKNKDKLVFELKGKKLKGTYVLVRFKKKVGEDWLFFRKKAEK